MYKPTANKFITEYIRLVATMNDVCRNHYGIPGFITGIGKQDAWHGEIFSMSFTSALNGVFYPTHVWKENHFSGGFIASDNIAHHFFDVGFYPTEIDYNLYLLCLTQARFPR